MNILSNILKIDYTKFIIINDEKIQKEIFEARARFDGVSKNYFYNETTIIKYNNIYYLYYLSDDNNKIHINFYDNNKNYDILLTYNYNKKYLQNYEKIENNKLKYLKANYLISINCNNSINSNNGINGNNGNNLKHLYLYLHKEYFYSNKFNKTKLSIIKFKYFINSIFSYIKKYNKQHKISILNYNHIKKIKYYYTNYKIYKFYIKNKKDIYFHKNIYNKDKYDIININNIQNKNIFIIKYNIIIFVIFIIFCIHISYNEYYK